MISCFINIRSWNNYCEILMNMRKIHSSFLSIDVMVLGKFLTREGFGFAEHH